MEQVQLEEVLSTEAAESPSVTLNITTFAKSQLREEVQWKEKLKQTLTEPDLQYLTKRSVLFWISWLHTMMCSVWKKERALGGTDLIEMEIDIGNATPRRQSARRMPFTVRQEVAKQLDQIQMNGVIKPRQRPWASPVDRVRKRNGTHRFCVDYRTLNSVDSFPLPRIEDLLDQLGSSKYFSTIDLASGFWQTKMHWRRWHL